MLDDDKGGELVNKLSLFPKEMDMYQKYLPAFEKLYKDVGWNIQLGPKCLYVEQNNNRINLVFEDLSERKFKNLNRLNGCDMMHMKRILRRLAELHAVSAVYEEQNGAYPESFQRGFVSEKGEEFQKSMFNVKVNAYKKAMLQWGLEDAQKYLDNFVS